MHVGCQHRNQQDQGGDPGAAAPFQQPLPSTMSRMPDRIRTKPDTSSPLSLRSSTTSGATSRPTPNANCSRPWNATSSANQVEARGSRKRRRLTGLSIRFADFGTEFVTADAYRYNASRSASSSGNPRARHVANSVQQPTDRPSAQLPQPSPIATLSRSRLTRYAECCAPHGARRRTRGACHHRSTAKDRDSGALCRVVPADTAM